MKAIRRTDKVDPPDSYLVWHSKLTARLGDQAELGRRDWQDLAQVEIFPGIPLGANAYVVPADWLPPGPMRLLKTRTVEAKLSPPSQVPTHPSWEIAVKRSLLGLILNTHRNESTIRIKPGTWISYARAVLQLAKWVIANAPSSDERLWSHIDVSIWNKAIRKISSAKTTRRTLAFILRRLVELGKRGVLGDFPNLEVNDLESHSSPSEKSRIFDNENDSLQSNKLSRIEPFSDQFVSECIKRCIWINQNLSLQIIEFYRERQSFFDGYLISGRDYGSNAVVNAKDNLIDNFKWTDNIGAKLTELPWEIKIYEGRMSKSTRKWPPRNLRSVYVLLGLIRSINFMLIAFCTAARSSEILSLDSGSAQAGDGSTMFGRTFKSSSYETGDLKEWPLHEEGARALDIQCKLADAVRGDANQNIWITVTGEDAGSPIGNPSGTLVRAVDALGLTHLAGARRAHAHRWRHTVARLVALSVVSAPEILMDLLGHKKIETTLHYMLSSPNLSQEVIKIADELSALTALEAIQDTDSGNAGGRAASPLKSGLGDFKMARGETALDAASLQDAMDILTFNGRFWQMVRPGIICTKTIGQFGPCTKGRGSPDPGACRTNCDHRLEIARAKQQCHDTLNALLREHSLASAAGLEMVTANLEGQILANLHRWDDVRQHYLLESEIARFVWAAKDQQNAPA